MNHRQLGKRRGVRGGIGFACAPLFAFLVGEPTGLARAGEFDRSTLPAAVAYPARCDGRNERVGVVKDSGDCKRIRGYITAGARFGPETQKGALPTPRGLLDAPEFVGAVRAAGAALIAAPAAGLDRIFLPPSGADEAR